MAKTMKAARFFPDETKIKLAEIPIPEPKDDEILVRSISSGLCHSDLVCFTDRRYVIQTGDADHE